MRRFSHFARQVARQAIGLAGVMAGGAWLAPAAAAVIGETTVVERAVTASGKASRPLERGSRIEANETILTNATGRGAFRFLDDTRLSVGPNSSIKLDRFVFDSSTTAKSFVIKATKGAFRFVTGVSAHDSYVIHTPAAVIGVRGTQFEVTIKNGGVTVSVDQGQVVLCPNNGRGNFVDCVEARAGQSILSSKTHADVAPTSSLPRSRDVLPPLRDDSLPRFGRLPTDPPTIGGLPNDVLQNTGGALPGGIAGALPGGGLGGAAPGGVGGGLGGDLPGGGGGGLPGGGLGGVGGALPGGGLGGAPVIGR